MAKKTEKPQFKTSWKNTQLEDTTQNNEIAEYGGIPLQIIEIDGKSILVTIIKESKLEFLDPTTLEKAGKTVSLATGKEKINLYKYRMVKIKGEWCLIFLKSLDDKEFQYEVVYYNISTKQTKILDKVRCAINDLIVLETTKQVCLFVAYMCNSGQITKYDLVDLVKIGDFDLSCYPDSANFYKLENNGQTVLMINYWDEDKKNYTTLLNPDTFSPLEDNEQNFYSHTYISEDNEIAFTTKSINDEIFIDTEFHILPSPDSYNRIELMKMVDIGNNNKQLIIVVTFYQYPVGDEVDIKHQTYLMAFDAGSKKQLYNILLCDDPENKIRVYPIIYHQTQLIISLVEKQECINKVYDLTQIEKEPLLFTDKEGNTNVGYNRDSCIINYEGKDFITLHKYRNDTHKRYFSLDTYQRCDEMTGICDKYDDIYKVLTYTDANTNRELFIVECHDYRLSSHKHITILHNPKGRIDLADDLERYYQPVYVENGKQSLIVTYTSKNNIKCIDAENGKELKILKIESKINQILVSEIKGKKALLVLSDQEIKAYYLSDLTDTDISYSNEYIWKMEVVEIDGKKQLLTDANNEELYTSDIENGKLVHNPLEIFLPDSNDETLGAIHDYKTLHSNGKDYMLITYSEGSESYLWYPNNNNKLTPLIIDEKMWDIKDGDPDFILTDAITIQIENKEYIVTLSHHGLITKFDSETGKRIGNVIQTESEEENSCIKVMDVGEEKILIATGNHMVKLWRISDLKKLKDIPFKESITGIEVAGQKIIVCHEQNITAIEIQ